MPELHSVKFFPVKVTCICGGEFEITKAPKFTKAGNKRLNRCPKCKAYFNTSLSDYHISIVYSNKAQLQIAQNYGKDGTDDS